MPPVNLTQLETFVRVAELGSFSKAAIVLDTAQPALSRQVRQLEAELRVTLLQRTGRGVVLTEAGQRLYEHGVGILELVSRAKEAVQSSRDEPSGRLIVGMPPSLGRRLAVPLVELFERELPKARLAIVEGLSAHVVEWIATGRVDVGLVYHPEPQPAIETEPLLDEPLLLVGPPSRVRGTVMLADLAAIPLVIPERSHAIRRLLEARAALAGVKLQVAWEVSSVPAILALVRSGHGHAVLTRDAIATEEGAGRLSARPIGDPPLVNTLSIATSAAKRASPLQRHVVRWLRELVRELLARPEAA
jgi:LysR family nitrogen assimilation transcriptional regulator